MSAISKIEWTDATWNPVRGCSLVSPGCTNCYAMRQAHRQSGPGGAYDGLTRLGPHGPVWTGDVRLVPELLDRPLRWMEPRRVFVNSMSDLFHERLSDDEIAAVFGVMAACPQHTFQVLTKRPGRMQKFLSQGDSRTCFKSALARVGGPKLPKPKPESVDWNRAPLPNVWLGVSVEDQATADERIPLLLQTPAAVRFVSYEPALGPVDFTRIPIRGAPSPPFSGSALHEYRGFRSRIDWLIVGGESGPRARPCDVEWIREAVRQCKGAGVPVFVKQMGARPIVPAGRLRHWEWGGAIREAARFEPTDPLNESTAPWFVRLRDRKGGDPEEWPEDLRVREFPAAIEAGEEKS